MLIYKLVVDDSIEERMLALSDRVLGHDADGATKFDEGDLQTLLAPLRALMEQGQTREEAARRWGRTGSWAEGI